MAKELSGSVGKISRMAILKSVMPIGYYAHPSPSDDTTLREIDYKLGDLAAKAGYKPGEQFEYEIIVRKK